MTVRTGSLTLAEAREAARAAKSGKFHSIGDLSLGAADSLRQRFLGHFGGAAKKTSAKRGRSAAKKSSFKKASAKKVRTRSKK